MQSAVSCPARGRVRLFPLGSWLAGALLLLTGACQAGGAVNDAGVADAYVAPCVDAACPRASVTAYDDVPWMLGRFDVDVTLNGSAHDVVSAPSDGSMVSLPTVQGFVSIAMPTASGTRVTLTLFDGPASAGRALRAGDTLHVIVRDPATQAVICDMTGTVEDAATTCGCAMHRLGGFVENV